MPVLRARALVCLIVATISLVVALKRADGRAFPKSIVVRPRRRPESNHHDDQLKECKAFCDMACPSLKTARP